MLVAIPAAVYALIALLTLWPKLTRTRRREGQEWDFAPVFWVANPSGVSSALTEDVEGVVQEARPSTAWGGARGNW